MRLRRKGPPAGVEALPVRSQVSSPSQVPIERLQLTVMRRLDGLLAGDYAGLFPGHGTERGEARHYIPGDDPRHIDWAVTARTGEPHVRDTIADHELDVWLVLDTSTSLAFGTARRTKHEVAWSAAGAFGLLASSGGNRVGATRTTTDGDGIRPLQLPPRSGQSHLGAVLAALYRPPSEGQAGDLGAAIDRVQRSARRRGMVVVCSDFIGEGGPDLTALAPWERPLRTLAYRHEVVAIEVVDPRELDLPDVGLVAVTDPESGRRRIVDTSRAATRHRYAELAARRRRDTALRLARCGADHLTLRTDHDWVLDLVRFVAGRKQRLLAAGRSG